MLRELLPKTTVSATSRMHRRHCLARGGLVRLRDFLGVGLEDAPPDHSTISRTRRLVDLETIGRC
jgi:hypothetical protein